MSRYIEGQDRQQVTLLPECLDDFIAEDNTVRIVDVFIDELDLVGLGFDGAKPAATGRPSYQVGFLERTASPYWSLTFANAQEEVREGAFGRSRNAITDLGKLAAEQLHSKAAY